MNNVWATVILFAYYVIAIALLPTLMRAIPGMPREVVRKTRHVGVSLSVFIFLELFTHWYAAVGAILLLGGVVYVALKIAQRYPSVISLVADRGDKGRDLPWQTLLTLCTFAALVAFYWGFLGAHLRYIVAVAALAWGFGDAAAALIGKAFGTTKFSSRFIEGPKSVAGTSGMMVVTAIAVFLTLTMYGPLPWYVNLIVALLISPLASVVELFTWYGLDTLSIPISVATATWLIVYIFEAVGWV